MILKGISRDLAFASKVHETHGLDQSRNVFALATEDASTMGQRSRTWMGSNSRPCLQSSATVKPLPENQENIACHAAKY